MTLKLERRIANELEGFCTRTGLNKTKAIEEILDDFLENLNTKQYEHIEEQVVAPVIAQKEGEQND